MLRHGLFLFPGPLSRRPGQGKRVKNVSAYIDIKPLRVYNENSEKKRAGSAGKGRVTKL
jgi:hypothetical protein